MGSMETESSFTFSNQEYLVSGNLWNPWLLDLQSTKFSNGNNLEIPSIILGSDHPFSKKLFMMYVALPSLRDYLHMVRLSNHYPENIVTEPHSPRLCPNTPTPTPHWQLVPQQILLTDQISLPSKPLPLLGA